MSVDPRRSKRSLSSPNRTRLLLAAAVVVISAAVWIVSETQRNTAERVFEESRAANRMLTAMLDQETGVRGFAISKGDQEFLEPYVRGGTDFDAALGDLRDLITDEGQEATVFSMVRAARRWQAFADDGIDQVRRDGVLDQGQVVQRKGAFDEFRRQSAALDEELTDERNRELDRAGFLSVFVIVVLGLAFAGFGFLVVERQTRRGRARRIAERAYRDTQAEFAETMQVMRDEPEAHTLVKEHLERSIPNSKVLVLNRNNSDNRLVASTDPDDRALAERLVDTEPESCLAVRLGRQYEQGGDVDPLLKCDVCGSTAPDVVCTPSLVGGEVIGSVLVRGGEALSDESRQRIGDSVSQASPVLANLRNLAIAETRAATDALTGLPNARSCRDNLKRMVAHAGRTVSPLTAVMFDLDHFKTINDRYGHGAGDDALAAVGEALRATIRTSDFGGRYGGEEFLMLLPGTDQGGALEVAEKLRHAIEALEFQQPDLKVTASFGIATYPLDALDSDSLVRMADRALYTAKANGRNRVELVEATGGLASPGTPAPGSPADGSGEESAGSAAAHPSEA